MEKRREKSENGSEFDKSAASSASWSIVAFSEGFSGSSARRGKRELTTTARRPVATTAVWPQSSPL